jgi:plasmid replication initiation protein
MKATDTFRFASRSATGYREGNWVSVIEYCEGEGRGDKGQWKPSIEEFMTAMDAPSSCRKDFGNLRMRIIEPAFNELREKENLVIEWEADRAGRKVAGLVFKFRLDPQGRLDL